MYGATQTGTTSVTQRNREAGWPQTVYWPGEASVRWTRNVGPPGMTTCAIEYADRNRGVRAHRHGNLPLVFGKRYPVMLPMGVVSEPVRDAPQHGRRSRPCTRCYGEGGLVTWCLPDNLRVVCWGQPRFNRYAGGDCHERSKACCGRRSTHPE